MPAHVSPRHIADKPTPTDVGAEEIQVVAHEDGQLRVFEEPNDACPPLVWMLWSLKSLTALSLDSLLY